MRSEIFRPARIDENTFADVLFRWSDVDIRLELRSLSRRRASDRAHCCDRARAAQNSQRQPPLHRKTNRPHHRPLSSDPPTKFVCPKMVVPKLLTNVTTCHRIGSGIALHEGMPCFRLPFFSSQKISPSVAFCTRSVRRLGFFLRPVPSSPSHFAQRSRKIRFPAAAACFCPAKGFTFCRSASGTFCSQAPSAAAMQRTTAQTAITADLKDPFLSAIPEIIG